MKSLAPLALVLAMGCGASGLKSYDAAYAEAPAAEAEEAFGYGGADMGGYGADADGFFDFDDAEIDGELMEPEGAAVRRDSAAMARQERGPSAPPQKKSKPKASSYQQQQGQKVQDPGPQAQGKGRAEKPEPEDPLVVYLGYLQLRVRRLLDAVDEITGITEEKGGYVESLTEDVVVVRIPAGDFEAVMALFAEVGELLERRVKALDVTEQFTDLGARLAVAREARARLLRLLEQVESVEERLRILQEIKRLSEQIESLESTLETLQNLVDFFTITIELVPVVEGSSSLTHRSPFPWVRDLAAHRTTIFDGRDDVEITLPDDFVLFEKDDVFRAQAADTTTIRAGRVDNEPLGDSDYWSAAVHHELDGRDEELVDEGEAGRLRYRVYRSRDVKPRYYLVAVSTEEDDLYVVEVFFPSEESHGAHAEDVLEALGTFKVR